MVAAGSITADEALKDLQDLLNAAQAVGQKIKELRPGEIGNGLGLLQKFIEIQQLIESTNSDTQKSAAISDDDAQKVIKVLQDIVATVVNFLLDLDSKASDFTSIEGAFILRCLESIWKNIRHLEESLQDKCPGEYQDIANGLIEKTNTKFSSSIKIYSYQNNG